MAPRPHGDAAPGARRGAGAPARHRYAREKILELVELETERSGGLVATKGELAERCGCVTGTVDLAVKGLRRAGAIEVVPQFDENGGQVANVYRTPAR